MSRLMSAIAGVLFCAAALQAEEAKPVKVLIVTGDHGHAWRDTTPFLKEVLTKAGHKVEVTERPRLDLIAANLKNYDVLLLNYRNTPKGATDNAESVWSEDNQRAFIEAIHDGLGLVVYHHASSAFTGTGEFDREFAGSGIKGGGEDGAGAGARLAQHP